MESLITSISLADVPSNLADLICAIKPLHDVQPHPVRVAIDGVDAAGKTTLADLMAPLIEKHDRPVIRASIDGFHNPQKVRYQQGADSPEGYYRDSFNVEALQRYLLIPLGPDGNRKYRRAAFNLLENAPTHETWHEASPNAILLFDGVFLLRPELIQYWDFSIFIDVEFSISVPRAIIRDSQQSLDGSSMDTVKAKYHQRYVPGQQLYFKEAKPMKQASIIVDNNDYRNPFIVTK